MAANDVKVTLSADDQATEIVRRLAAAVKQLDQQNRATAASTNEAKVAASGAATAYGAWEKSLRRVIAAFSVFKIAQFVKGTIDANDELSKLAQKTGATTEALSALAVAGSTADVPIADLTTLLKFLSKSLTDLQSGSVEAQAAFAAFGLTAKDFQGLSIDQALVKIADAQSQFEDGAAKSAVTLRIFGRAGSEIIPLLNDLADGGFARATQKAKELGVELSGPSGKAAEDFNDRLKDLKTQAQGVVTQLTPLIKLVTGLFKISQVVSAPENKALGSIFDFLFGGSGDQKAVADQVAKTAADATKAAQKKKVNFVDPALQKAAIEAQLAAAKQAASGQLAIAQAGFQQQQQIAESAFAQGLTSIRQFYAQRLAIAQQGTQAQIDALEKEKRALEASPLSENTDAARIQRALQVAAIETQIKQLKIEGATKAAELTEQERIATKNLRTELAGFAAEIDRAKGDQIGAAQVEIEQTVQRFGEALRKINGLSTDAINDLSNRFQQLLTNRAAFDQSQRQSELVINGLQLDRQQIQQRVNQGIISEREGELQLAALERSRIPALQQLAAQMEFFAEQTKDPTLVQAARQLRIEIEGMGHVTDEAAIKMANLGANLADATQNSLSNFLGDTISRVNSLGDGIRQLATTIVGSIQRVLADAISTQAIQAIRGLFEGAREVPAAAALTAAGASVSAGAVAVGTSAVALGGAGSTLIAAAAALGLSAAALQASVAEMAVINAFGNGGIGALIPGFASGGLFRGRGTGKSDSNIIAASDGEFIVNADSTRRNLRLLEAINGGRTPTLRTTVGGLPAFASGGLVMGGGSSATLDGGIELSVSADEGLAVQLVKTRGFKKALGELFASHPNEFKAHLDIG